MINKRVPPKKEIISFNFFPEKNQIHVIFRECYEDVTEEINSFRFPSKDGIGQSAGQTSVYSHIKIYKYIYGVDGQGKMCLKHIIPGEYVPATYTNANYSFEDNSKIELY